MNALDKQVGGNHYKGFQMQPIELITNLNLSFLQGCVIKRICRYDRQGGKGNEDLNKILHEIELIVESKDFKIHVDYEVALRNLCMFMVVNSLTPFQRKLLYDFINIFTDEDSASLSYSDDFKELKKRLEQEIAAYD